jgi:hypothetical protein
MRGASPVCILEWMAATGDVIAGVALVLSFLSLLVTGISTWYHRRRYQVDRRRLDAELGRVEPTLRLQNVTLRHLIDVLPDPSAERGGSSIARGVLRGRRYGRFTRFGYATHKYGLAPELEGRTFDLTGMEVMADVTIVNPSAVSFWVHGVQAELCSTLAFPRVLALVEHYSLWDSSIPLSREHLDKTIVNFSLASALAFPFRRWFKTPGGGCQVIARVNDEETRKSVRLDDSLQVRPGEKKLWQVTLELTREAVEFLLESGYKPSKFTLHLGWDGGVARTEAAIDQQFYIAGNGNAEIRVSASVGEITWQ